MFLKSMVELHQVFLDREKSTGLNFGIRGYSRHIYFIQKYHIFDPKTGNILINKITRLEERNQKEISLLKLGSSSQSIDFITDIPNCTLIRRLKPILNSEDIFYISNSSSKVKTRIFTNYRRSAFYRGTALTCELYLPSTLFKKIEKIKDKITLFPKYKSIENRHKLYYRDFIFTTTSNYQKKGLNKNAEFLEDLHGITGKSMWENNIVTEKFKDKILLNMRNFIEKYTHFEVEN